MSSGASSKVKATSRLVDGPLSRNVLLYLALKSARDIGFMLRTDSSEPSNKFEYWLIAIGCFQPNFAAAVGQARLDRCSQSIS